MLRCHECSSRDVSSYLSNMQFSTDLGTRTKANRLSYRFEDHGHRGLLEAYLQQTLSPGQSPAPSKFPHQPHTDVGEVVEPIPYRASVESPEDDDAHHQQQLHPQQHQQRSATQTPLSSQKIILTAYDESWHDVSPERSVDRGPGSGVGHRSPSPAAEDAVRELGGTGRGEEEEAFCRTPERDAHVASRTGAPPAGTWRDDGCVAVGRSSSYPRTAAAQETGDTLVMSIDDSILFTSRQVRSPALLARVGPA